MGERLVFWLVVTVAQPRAIGSHSWDATLRYPYVRLLTTDPPA